MKNLFLHVAILLGLAASTAAASPYITITPLSQTSILPGATVGWGFTIHPDDNDFLVINTVYLTESTSLGIFTDFLELYLPFAPNSPDQFFPFDLAFSSGVGQYVIDPGTALSSSNTIQFNISYELDPCDISQFSCASDFSGLILMDQANNTPTATIQIADSLSPPTESVPEPGTIFTVSSAVLLALRARYADTSRRLRPHRARRLRVL